MQDWCNWNAFVMSERPMWELFPKLSKIDEFELFTTNIVRSEFFIISDEYWIWCEVK